MTELNRTIELPGLKKKNYEIRGVGRLTKKVLIFSEHFGLGHQRAGQAMAGGIKILDPTAQVLHTDSIQQSYPRMKKAFLGAYLKFINSFPNTWHKLYQSSRTNRDNKTSKDILHLLLAKKIRSMIEEFQPHTIVCTHPFPASVVSELKNRGLHIPMAGVITDYDLHALWVDQKIDHYIFGDQKLQDSFAQFGFKPPSASFEGIPVDPVFDRETDKDELKTRLQINPREPLVLVAGGGWGLGDLGGITAQLASQTVTGNVIVICGTNTRLAKKLKRRFAGYPGIRIAGYVDNMYEYIMAADVVVTKPGGLTTTECLAAGVPMVLFDVLYGQEYWNSKFLVEGGAAMRCDHITEIPQLVNEVTGSTVLYERMSKRAKALGKPRAGLAAAEQILRLATENSSSV